MSDRERTLVDALVDPSWVGGIRHLTEMLVTYGRSASFDATKLLVRLGDARRGGAYKRLGDLAEMHWPGQQAVIDAALAGRTKGIIRLDPAVDSRGRMNKRWGLWLNVPIVRGDADDSYN